MFEEIQLGKLWHGVGSLIVYEPAKGYGTNPPSYTNLGSLIAGISIC
jgi:hypothetical protein